jgi:RNA polymerase sigma-70 factor (ECF subfamily)
LTYTIRDMKNIPADEEAGALNRLEAAIQEHWEPIYAVLFRILGDRFEAEDLALETFWVLYQKPPASTDQLGSWLYRVATNLGLNALRAARRRRTREQQAASLDSPGGTENPAVEVEHRLERQRARRVLAEMKDRDARLLVLRHSGLAYAEIAEVLGVAPGSVGTLLARAESNFKRRYQTLEERGG